MPATIDWHELARRWEFAAAVASRVAHDLSNIFMGVNGFTELAQFQLPNDHPSRAYLRDVMLAGQRGIDLAQRMHLLRTCGSVQAGVGDIAAAMTQAWSRMSSPEVTIDIDIPDGLPAVRMGHDSLRIVFQQLLQNAVESFQTTGIVRVSASSIELGSAEAGRLAGNTSPGSHVEVRMADRGVGIVPETRDRLWETPVATTKPGARGLGLAIAFRTLYAHRGGLELLAGPDGGTVARVCLPVAGTGAAE